MMSWYTLTFHLKKIKRLFKNSSGILRITMLNQKFKKQNICAIVFLNAHEPHLMANTNCTASESQFFMFIYKSFKENNIDNYFSSNVIKLQ